MSSTREVPQMDWGQVVLNGGPPCFAVLNDERPWFCGRADRWAGHDGDHKFVSLQDYVRQQEEEVRAAFVSEIEKHLNCAEHGASCASRILAALRRDDAAQEEE